MIFNVTGGGTALNFSVVGGTTKPTNPKENTIWINTGTSITSWVFSPTAPASPAAGMVWIATATASSAAFNALKKNTLQVLPQEAKQYVSGAWVSKAATTYQSGAWKSWTVSLYESGNEFDEVTGGWVAKKGSGGVVTFGSTALTLTYTGDSERTAAAHTAQKVRITGNKLYCKVNITANGQFFEFGTASSITSSETISFGSKTTIESGKTGSMTVTIDTSGAVGKEYYIIARTYGATTAKISKVWMA